MGVRRPIRPSSTITSCPVTGLQQRAIVANCAWVWTFYLSHSLRCKIKNTCTCQVRNAEIFPFGWIRLVVWKSAGLNTCRGFVNMQKMEKKKAYYRYYRFWKRDEENLPLVLPYAPTRKSSLPIAISKKKKSLFPEIWLLVLRWI